MLIALGKQLFAGALILLVLTMGYGSLWFDRLFGESRLATVSTTERVILLDQAKEIISEFWVLGLGMGNYLVEVIKHWPGEEIFFYQPVHNTWLLLWAELGLVGLFVFFTWVWLILRWLEKLMHKSESSISHHFVYISIFVIGIMAYFDHFWWTLPFGLLLAAIYFGLFLKFED